ncbi:hypothetical protein, partial [Staphylococcus haemolyticus]|uniref:hypothetical protein n=1 Tax=Staphylococcus haemolyticus TaxID=1283 RepID=UPI001C92E910
SPSLPLTTSPFSSYPLSPNTSHPLPNPNHSPSLINNLFHNPTNITEQSKSYTPSAIPSPMFLSFPPIFYTPPSGLTSLIPLSSTLQNPS